MPGHVRVARMSGVGQGAHDVEQDLLAVVIEVSPLRHSCSLRGAALARGVGADAWRTL
jgi:hypothetical protein